MTNELKAKIAAAQARFAERTRALEGKPLEMLLRGMTGRRVGFGEGEIDPVEHALARHSLRAIELVGVAERAQQEHAELSRTPPPHMTRTSYLARLDALEQEHGAALARLHGLREQGFGREVAEAAAMYADAEAEAARIAGIREAAVTRAAELRAAAPDHATEMAARAIAERGE